MLKKGFWPLFAGCVFLLGSGMNALAAPGEWKNLRSAVFRSYYIRAFARDQSRIFIGTTQGLYFKKKNEDRISFFLPLGNIYISGIYPAGEDVVWCATYNGIYQINLSNFQILAHYTKSGEKNLDGTPTVGGLSSDSITCIAGHDEVIYAGTDRWGVSLIDLKSGRVMKERITSIDGLPCDTINHISVTPSLVLISTTNGVAWSGRWDNSWETLPEKSIARGVKVQQAVFQEGRIYLATGGEGVLAFSPDNPDAITKYSSAKKNIPFDFVRGLARDGKYLWVATLEGLSRHNVVSGEWETFPGFTKESLDRVFIDGNYVYVGSDGDGVFVMDKVFPEIEFFPEISYDGKKMNIIGAVVSDQKVLAVDKAKFQYRDADIGGDYVSAGLTSLIQGGENIFHSRLGFIDFEKAGLSVGKLWNFEVSLEAATEGGAVNRATERFLYDSKKPRIDLLKFGEESIAITADKNFRIEGKVIERRIREFSYRLGDNKENKRAIFPDRFGNFNEIIPLSGRTNQIVFRAVDYCYNEAERGITLVIDDVKPALATNIAEVLVTEEDPVAVFPYIEENIDIVQIRDPESPLPIPVRIDKGERKIYATLKPPSNPKNLTLEISDKAKNKSIFPFQLKRDEDRPLIKLAEEDEIKTEFKAYVLAGRVISPKKFEFAVYKGDARIPSVVNESNQFQVTFEMTEMTNRYRIAANLPGKRPAQKWIQVISSLKPGTGGAKAEIVAVQTKPRDELQELKDRLKALENQGRPVVVQGTGGLPPEFYGNQPALMAASLSPGETLAQAAGRFYGNAANMEIITYVNQHIPAKEIRDRNRIVIPNGAMIEWLNRNQNPAVLELVKSFAYGLFFNPPGNVSGFARMVQSFSQSFLVPVVITPSQTGIIITQSGPEDPNKKLNKIVLDLMGNIVRVQFI